MNKNFIITLIIILLILLTGCDNKPLNTSKIQNTENNVIPTNISYNSFSENSYLPLNINNEWNYEYKAGSNQFLGQKRDYISGAIVNGKKVFVMNHEFRNKINQKDYSFQNNSGIFSIRKDVLLNSVWVSKNYETPLLVIPNIFSEGINWSSKILENGIELNMKSSIERKMNITVPAGTFETYLINTKITNKAANIDMFDKRWYAKNIGLISQEFYDFNNGLYTEKNLVNYTLN